MWQCAHISLNNISVNQYAIPEQDTMLCASFVAMVYRDRQPILSILYNIRSEQQTFTSSAFIPSRRCLSSSWLSCCWKPLNLGALQINITSIEKEKYMYRIREMHLAHVMCKCQSGFSAVYKNKTPSFSYDFSWLFPIFPWLRPNKNVYFMVPIKHFYCKYKVGIKSTNAAWLQLHVQTRNTHKYYFPQFSRKIY